MDATAALKIDVSNLHPFTLKSNQVTDNTLIFSVSSSMAGNGELTLYNGIGNKVLSLHLELEAASLHSVDITKSFCRYIIHWCTERTGWRSERNLSSTNPDKMK